MSDLDSPLPHRLFCLIRKVHIVPLLVLLCSGILVFFLGLAVLSAGEIYEYQDTVDGVHLPEVDAIVCLAGGRGRIAAAGDLWYRYWELSQSPLKELSPSPVPARVPVLYFSGMGPQANWASLSKKLRRGLVGVIRPEQQVIIETKSTNTEGNALWLSRFAREHGWQRILLVTSSYHIKRAKYIFDEVLHSSNLPVRVETLSVFQDPFEAGEWRGGFHGVRVTLTEYLKWLYYRKFWHPQSVHSQNWHLRASPIQFPGL